MLLDGNEKVVDQLNLRYFSVEHKLRQTSSTSSTQPAPPETFLPYFFRLHHVYPALRDQHLYPPSARIVPSAGPTDPTAIFWLPPNLTSTSNPYDYPSSRLSILHIHTSATSVTPPYPDFILAPNPSASYRSQATPTCQRPSGRKIMDPWDES